MAALTTGDAQEKMLLYNYLQELPADDDGMRTLIDTVQRALLTGIAGLGGDLTGGYAAVWARIRAASLTGPLTSRPAGD